MGFFSRMNPIANTPVFLGLPANDSGIIELRGKVARSRRVPAQLVSVASQGVGLRLTMAPPEWYEFVAGLSSSEPRNTPSSSAQPGPHEEPTASERAAALKKRKRKLPPRMAPPESKSRYRMQVKHIGGPRSRSLVVSASSREDAESVALEEVGGDWKVTDVEGA